MDSLDCDIYDSELIKLCEELEENEELCEVARFVSQNHREATSQIGRGMKRTAAVSETEEVSVKKNRPVASQHGASTSFEPAPAVNDGETHLKFELHPLGEGEDLAKESAKATQIAEKPLPMISDDSPVRAFLNGENCLNGGTGWWKYEFCYGQHVVQYHVNRNGEKTTLMLGRFDEQAHLKWIKENKGKAPKPLGQRTSITHFYSDGDVCDKTGKPRQTEVKLKCLENSSSSAQVSLYLLEPRTCHYILGVESPLICDILPYADENGVIKSNPLLGKKEEAIELKEEEDVKPEVVPTLEND